MITMRKLDEFPKKKYSKLYIGTFFLFTLKKPSHLNISVEIVSKYLICQNCL